MSRPVDFSNLVEKIEHELADEKFSGIIHGTHEGARPCCSGPMCRKYRRDVNRRHHGRDLREDSPDEQFLKQVIAAHARKVLILRAEETAKKMAS